MFTLDIDHCTGNISQSAQFPSSFFQNYVLGKPLNISSLLFYKGISAVVIMYQFLDRTNTHEVFMSLVQWITGFFC